MIISFVCTYFLKSLLTMLFDTNLGPDRRIFLPDGLLDRSEIPEYLNGEVPGEYGSIFFILLIIEVLSLGSNEN